MLHSPIPNRCSRRSLLCAGLPLLHAPAAAAAMANAEARIPPTRSPMRCAASYGDKTYHTLCLHGFADDLRERSRGEMDLQITANQALRKMPDVIPSLARGELEFGEVLMSACSEQMPVLAMDTVPFIVRSWTDSRRMWASSRPLVAGELARHGVRLLYAVPWPPQGLFSAEPVQSFADLRGKRFRVFNAINRRLCELAGGVPVDVSGKDLTVAIAERRVEVMVTSSTTGVDSEAWTTMKYFGDVRAWLPKNMVLMSERLWRSLGRDLQAAVDRAAARAEIAGWEMAQRADDVSKKFLADRGMKIETPSIYLRRELDSRGERFGAEFARLSHTNAAALVQYYTARNH